MQETANEWLIYKSKVHNLSYINYKLYKHIINPNNYPSGAAGTEGAYQLDHIIPKRYCFDNNIPFELCAHPTNLQMIPWLDNVKKRTNIDFENIPYVLVEYFQNQKLNNEDTNG